MDKQKILAAISLALDALEAEPERLVLDWELRSIKTAQWAAEVQIKDGVLARFSFYDVPITTQEAESRERAHRQYDEPDWTEIGGNLQENLSRNQSFYDELFAKLDIKK